VIFVGPSVPGLEFVCARRMFKRFTHMGSEMAGAIFGKAGPEKHGTTGEPR